MSIQEQAPEAPYTAPAGEDLAIVLSGGGARAAYQVGVLRGMARHLPEMRFPIIAGVSAGAINAAFLAAHPGTAAEAAQALSALWCRLQVEDIFQVDPPSLSRDILKWGRWAARLAIGDSLIGPELRGLLDTDPLRQTIRHASSTVDGELIGIERNLEIGKIRAIAVTALNYMTGQSVTWVQGDSIVPFTQPQRRTQHIRLTVEHIMASCSLPLLFPAVRLAGAWYGDGGVRLSAPLSPALRLGASRVLAISPNYEPSREEADRHQIPGYPPIAQILSQLLDTIFLDVLDEDVRRLESMNELVAKIAPENRGSYRPVEILVVRPSVDLGKLAVAYEPRLPDTFRLLARSLGSQEATTSDFLSMLMFQPDYLERLMEIGEADAEAQMDEIRALLAPSPPGPLSHPLPPPGRGGEKQDC
jgi:NTE family protein